MRRSELGSEANQSFDEDAENIRIDLEVNLSMKWEESLAESGFDEALYVGDESALIAAINEALENMG